MRYLFYIIITLLIVFTFYAVLVNNPFQFRIWHGKHKLRQRKEYDYGRTEYIVVVGELAAYNTQYAMNNFCWA